MSETMRIGRRGTVVVPAKLRRLYGMEEGTMVVAEEWPYGVLLRPAAVVPVEIYSSERKAGFLLTNATDQKDYAKALDEVRRMGLDPKRIKHRKPRSR